MCVVEAQTQDDIGHCYAVMAELRSELSLEEYLRRVALQRADEAYRLVYMEVDGVPACVAGFRIAHNLSAGRHLYVDDLVTAQGHRGRGLGVGMMQWLEDEARRSGCLSLHLDSGVQRHDAHRLYIKAGMDIVFYHFRKVLGA